MAIAFHAVFTPVMQHVPADKIDAVHAYWRRMAEYKDYHDLYAASAHYLFETGRVDKLPNTHDMKPLELHDVWSKANKARWNEDNDHTMWSDIAATPIPERKRQVERALSPSKESEAT